MTWKSPIKNGQEVAKIMTKAIEYKEKIIQVYKSYETYIPDPFQIPVAFFVFGYINDNLGYYRRTEQSGDSGAFVTDQRYHPIVGVRPFWRR